MGQSSRIKMEEVNKGNMKEGLSGVQLTAVEGLSMAINKKVSKLQGIRGVR
jgi:hypothetical protein